MHIKQFEESLHHLNHFTQRGEGINRLAFTAEEKKAKEYLIEQFKKENMKVNVDAVGNIIARRPGIENDQPAVAFGSHIDTVYEAGEYDGAIGVIAALEIIKYFNEKNIKTRYPLEVLVFTGEESSRFGLSTIGSRSMAGLINLDEKQDIVDKEGITLREAFLENNLDIEKYKEAKRSKGEFLSFIELHIEQGPVLENERIELGIVNAIAAPLRLDVEITGRAAHSGTTPYKYRSDAFLGVAELGLYVEEIAKKEEKNGALATVGVIDVKPGAMNIVPGSAHMQIDIRSITQASKEAIYDSLQTEIDRISTNRKLKIKVTILTNEQPVKMSQTLVNKLRQTCELEGYSHKFINSGAGHDAMNMARLCPSAMIFVPSKNGVSHNPEEYTSFEDIFKGVRVMKDLILEIADGGVELESIKCRNQKKCTG